MDADIVLLNEEAEKLALSISDSKSSTNTEEFEEIQNHQYQSNSEEDLLELVYEGNFEKGILVVYPGSHLDPEFRSFLFLILQAVNCSLKDIALCSSESVEEVPLETIQEMGVNKVLVFGKLNHSLSNLMVNLYEILTVEGVEYLFVDDIREIFQNKSLKISLWTKLQVMFNIKK